MTTSAALTAPAWNPAFDGTAGSTTADANPELASAIKMAAAAALKAEVPSASNIRIQLSSTAEGVPPTSERALYDHFGFVDVSAKACTRAGSIAMEGKYNANTGELMFVDFTRN